MGIKVLSLFDGISAGQVALNRLGIEIDTYWASEIDKFAISITQRHYPNTIQLGSVTEWRNWDIDWSSIDLLHGGSPCQGFSFAGKQLNFDDDRSKLFFDYVDILNHVKKHNPNVKFLLENVKMKKTSEEVITKYMGVDPIFINSRLLSAQNRPRLYWTNIEGIEQPEDKGLILRDILEDDDKVNPKYLLTPKCLLTMDRHRNGRPRWEYHKNPLGGKAACIVASFYKLGGLGVLDYRNIPGKKPRRLTPLECERLQTFPDNYTDTLSQTQRYKAIGNSWTVDVIAHIYSFI
jgi:site-specific DNA-cytosine methylase